MKDKINFSDINLNEIDLSQVKVTEIQHKENAGNRVLVLIFGIFFLFISCLACINIEKSGNENKQILNFIKKNAISVSSLKPENEGKLIAYTSTASSDEVLSDGILSMQVITLKRLVEKKEFRNIHEKREYKKQKEKVRKISKHAARNMSPNENQVEWVSVTKDDSISVGTKTLYAQNVTFGDFTLTEETIKNFYPSQKLVPLPKHPNYENAVEYYNIYSSHKSNLPSAYSQKPARRMSYYYAPANTKYTIVGKQSGNTIDVYKAGSLNVIKVQAGNFSLSKLIKTMETGNNFMTIITRIFLFFFFYAASALIFIGLKKNGCLLGLITALPLEIIVINIASSL